MAYNLAYKMAYTAPGSRDWPGHLPCSAGVGREGLEPPTPCASCIVLWMLTDTDGHKRLVRTDDVTTVDEPDRTWTCKFGYTLGYMCPSSDHFGVKVRQAARLTYGAERGTKSIGNR